MTNKNKYLVYRYLIPVVIFIILWFLLGLFDPNIKTPVRITIIAAVTFILSPRVKIINFMTGKNIQIKWLILGKIILLPMDESFKK